MKELQAIQKDVVEIPAIKPIKKEERFVGRISPHKGQHVYELNTITGDIRQLTDNDFEDTNVSYPVGKQTITTVRRKLLVNERCVYVAALNKPNAAKKFKKFLQQL